MKFILFTSSNASTINIKWYKHSIVSNSWCGNFFTMVHVAEFMKNWTISTRPTKNFTPSLIRNQYCPLNVWFLHSIMITHSTLGDIKTVLYQIWDVDFFTMFNAIKCMRKSPISTKPTFNFYPSITRSAQTSLNLYFLHQGMLPKSTFTEIAIVLY